MKVLLINNNRHRRPMPVMPLGACRVAEATAAAGHEVRLLDLMFAGDPHQAVARELRRFPAEVIGVSQRNLDNNDMLHPVFSPPIAGRCSKASGP